MKSNNNNSFLIRKKASNGYNYSTPHPPKNLFSPLITLLQKYKIVTQKNRAGMSNRNKNRTHVNLDRVQYPLCSNIQPPTRKTW